MPIITLVMLEYKHSKISILLYVATTNVIMEAQAVIAIIHHMEEQIKKVYMDCVKISNMKVCVITDKPMV